MVYEQPISKDDKLKSFTNIYIFFKKQAEVWHFNYNIESYSWNGSQKGLLDEIVVEQDVIVESQEQEAEKE